MKTSHLLLTASLVLGHSSFSAAAHAAKEPQAPVPVTQGATPAPASRETYNYDQRLYGAGTSIIAPAAPEAMRATSSNSLESFCIKASMGGFVAYPVKMSCRTCCGLPSIWVGWRQN